MKIKDLTQCQTILLAVFHNPGLTYEGLVVKSWELAPDKFGLAGYNYPSSHRVSSTLYAKQGPIRLRLIETSGASCRYFATGAGEGIARSLTERINGTAILNGEARPFPLPTSQESQCRTPATRQAV